MSSWSWIVVALGLIAAVIAVQFDEPWLEISGSAAFVLLFAWVVVALRAHANALKSELSKSALPPRGRSGPGHKGIHAREEDLRSNSREDQSHET